MFGRTKSPEAEKKIPIWQKATALGAAAFILIGCGNKVDATDGPTPTSSPAVIETTPNTTPDVTLAPTTTIESPSTSSEAPITGTETEAPVDQKLYVENVDGSVSFPVEAYVNNREQLVKDFVEVGLTEWVNAGATPENIDTINAETKGQGTSAKDAAFAALAEQNTAVYADKLFDGWQDKAPERATVAKFTAANAAALDLYARSHGAKKYNNGPDAGDYYHVQLKANNVKVTDEGPAENPFVQSKVSIEFTSNFEESAISDQDDPGSNFAPIDRVEGTVFSPILTFNEVNGNYEVTIYLDYTQ